MQVLVQLHVSGMKDTEVISSGASWRLQRMNSCSSPTIRSKRGDTTEQPWSSVVLQYASVYIWHSSDSGSSQAAARHGALVAS
jgi:hypothetical protein